MSGRPAKAMRWSESAEGLAAGFAPAARGGLNARTQARLPIAGGAR